MTSINENENWGNLVEPRRHAAAVGARLADNPRRDFAIFGNRITVVGQDAAAKRLLRLLFSRRTLRLIARSSRFMPGCEASEASISGLALGKKYKVDIHVCCRGEYCHVQAYADRTEEYL